MIETTLDILSRLVAFPTVSNDSNLDLIDYSADLLSAVDARIDVTSSPDGTKANLLATIGPDIDGGIVLSGHTDVVPVEGQDWHRHPFATQVENGLIYGRGTTDMKGFIACVLAMAPVFARSQLAHPIHIALTYDEEEGCHGARVMLERLDQTGPKPAVAIIGEPTRHEIVVANKGCYEFTTEITGPEQHASMGASGAGAIHAAGRFIAKLTEIAEQLQRQAPPGSLFDPPFTTINVGTIQGGVARNITAGSAKFDWEFRPVDQHDLALVQESVERFVSETLLPDMQREFSEATITTTIVGAVGGFRPDPNGPAVHLAKELTGNDELKAVSFGTEAGLFQEAGIAPVVCGPGDIVQAHKPDEFIAVAQLEECLDVLGRLAKKMA